VHSLPGTLGA